MLERNENEIEGDWARRKERRKGRARESDAV